MHQFFEFKIYTYNFLIFVLFVKRDYFYRKICLKKKQLERASCDAGRKPFLYDVCLFIDLEYWSLFIDLKYWSLAPSNIIKFIILNNFEDAQYI